MVRSSAHIDSPPHELASPEAPVGPLLGRLRRLIPVVRRLLGKVKALGFVSAASALLIWAVWFDPLRLVGDSHPVSVLVSLAVLLFLLLPSGAAWLGHRMLREILELPRRLGELGSEATLQARTATGEDESPGRVVHVFRIVWMARRLVIDASGIWGTALGAARLARLASLPYALLILLAFALNFVVIGLGLVTVLVVLAL